MIAQASRATADAAMAVQNWVSVEIKKPVDFRVLRGVFLDLPTFLTNPPKTKNSFYRDIARVLGEKFPHRTFFPEAGDLDMQAYNVVSSRHVLFTEYLAKLIKKKVIEATEVGDGVRIPIEPVYKYSKTHGVSLPPLGVLTELLTNGGTLIGADKDYWTYSLYAWNFYRSFS
jgi:hypothetical protein